MSAPEWAWTDAATGERWRGPFADVETACDDARQSARESDAPPDAEFWVAVCSTPPLAQFFPDADELIERADERIADELFNDAESIDAGKDAVTELDERLGALLREWVEKHALNCPAYKVDLSTRCVFKVIAPTSAP